MRSLLKITLPLLAAILVNPAANATVAKDETPWPTAQFETQPTLRVFGDKPLEKRPIFIFAFVHDDIPDSQVQSIFPDHFLAMIKEITAVTGRRVSVEFIRHTPPYTNYAYKASDQDAYDGWAAIAQEYRNSKNIPFNRTTKFLLLTNEAMNSQTAGLASLGQPFGLASLLGKQIVGHEVGHMLDADHEFSDVRFNGWWCETFMAAKVNQLLSNCYVYADANRERINTYLRDSP